MSPISRRRFLGGIVAFVAGSVVYKSITIPSADKWVHGKPKDNLENFALNLKGINFEIADQDQLNHLEEKLLARNWQKINSSTDFSRWIQETIKAEFIAEKTADINGWVVSEFERDMISYALLVKEKEGVTTKENSGSFQSAKIKHFINVNDWGPKATCVGMSFNPQSDGHSSHWLSTEPYNGRLVVYIGGKAIPTTKGTGAITTKIEGAALNEIIGSPSALDFMLYDPARNIKQKIGIFEVHAQPERAVTVDGKVSRYFGVVSAWGPKSIPLSEFIGAKKTPLWIKTSCAPTSAEIKLGSIPLKTVVGPNLVTGTSDITTSEIASGKVGLNLVDRKSGESIFVGEIELTT